MNFDNCIKCFLVCDVEFYMVFLFSLVYMEMCIWNDRLL